MSRTPDARHRFREACDGLSERCFALFPCIADPTRRASLCLKTALLFLHLIIAGFLFLFDDALLQKAHSERWYIMGYLVLFLGTLIQYFYTSGSSPGYVEDAMQAQDASQMAFLTSSKVSKHSASGEKTSLLPSADYNPLGRSASRLNSNSWLKSVMDLYPPGTSVRNWTCSYCNIIQPPRTKHCHDCEKCVLQFDHHCLWLGTCIGLKNHCRFWWYIFEETILCIWTTVLYFSYLTQKVSRPWWNQAAGVTLLAILLLSLIFLLLLLFFHSYLVLTNQTTYELVRRRRIFYLRGIPERVHPFSKGVRQNLYDFCCFNGSAYTMEPIPSIEDLEAKAKPYTCMDVVSCRCC